MIAFVARAIFSFTLVAAVALLLRAYADIGDGFSAGALAGLGAVLQYVAHDYGTARRRVAARLAPTFLALGLLLTLLVTLVPIAAGLPPVTHFPRPGSDVAHLGALELHTGGLFDLGVAVAVYGAVVGTFDRLFLPRRGSRP